MKVTVEWLSIAHLGQSPLDQIVTYKAVTRANVNCLNALHFTLY